MATQSPVGGLRRIRHQSGSPGILSSSILLLLTVGAHAALSSEQVKERFLNEAPKTWAEYRVLASRFQGNVTEVFKKNGEVVNEKSTEVKQNGKCRMVINCFARKDSKAFSGVEVYAQNASYAFSLKKERPERAWVLTAMGFKGDGEPLVVVEHLDWAFEVLGSPVMLYSESLAELVKQPSFRIVKAEELKEHGRSLVRISFDNRHSSEANPFFPIQSGSVTLDPQWCWCVRDGTILNRYAQGESRAQVSVTAISAPGRIGTPIPKRAVAETEALYKPMKGSLLTDFALSVPVSLPPDSDFTLSAFGFPEPTPQRAGSRLYIWLFVGGIVCLIAGIGIRRFRRIGNVDTGTTSSGSASVSNPSPP